jgi:Fic family protein
MPFLEIDEYRLLDGWSRDKKRGSHRYERIPTDLFRIEEFSADADYIRCIPENCEDTFTLAEFAKEARISGHAANGVVKVLMERGLLERVGKRGRAYLYTRTY